MSKLVIALDYTDTLDALNMANTLRGSAEWMKVGLELFTREGPRMLQTLKGMGFKVMLDLKLFDIPNTVRGGVRSACWIGADMITVHLLGGERMIRAAVDEVQKSTYGTRPLIFGVTVLTSMEQGELPGYTQNITSLAEDLAYSGMQWGLNGVVCSGHEARNIKARCPGLQCLTPGIRLESTSDDQRRVMTPAEAVAAGSDFLVVGRPVTQAADPAAAAKAITSSITR